MSTSASLIVELSGSAQWRSATSVAAGSPSARRKAPVLGERVQRRIPGGLDAVRFQLGAEAVTRVAVGEQDREGEMAGALDGLLVEAELDTGELGADARGRRERSRAGRRCLRRVAQTAQSERGPRLVEAEVEADVDHVVGGIVTAVAVPGAARHGVGAKQPDALVERLVGAADHAALADAQLLLGEEAEAAQLADGADLAAAVVDAGADRLGAVLDQDEPVLVAELSQREHLGRIAAEVHGDDRARAGVMRRATSSGSRLKSCALRTSQRTGSAPT